VPPAGQPVGLFRAGLGAFSLATVWAAIALSYVSDWPVGLFVGTIGALLYGAGRMRTQLRTRCQLSRFALRR